MNSFDDVRYHFLRNIISIAKRKIMEVDRQGEQAKKGEACSWAGRAVHLLMTIIMVCLEIQVL